MSTVKNFLDYLKNSTVYCLLGKGGKWNDGDAVDQVWAKSPESMVEDFNDGIFAKKVNPGQFSLATARHDWESGNVYAQWHPNDDALKEKAFFTVNDSGHVYKCISNNGGVPSMEMPSVVTPTRFQTSDGYIWKYVASIPEPIQLQYNYADYIPIKNVDDTSAGYEMQYASQVAAIPGTIDRLDVVQGGKKYSAGTTITIQGDGTGATATPVIHGITGEILSVAVTNNGKNYTHAIATVNDPSHIGGEGAILAPIVSPLMGHGADPEKELFCDTIIGQVNIELNEEGFIRDTFDFRKVTLIRDIQKTVNAPIEVSPKMGLTYVNPSEPFVVDIYANVVGIHSMDVSINNTVVKFFANPANPYGEEVVAPENYTVAYSAELSRWRFTFDTTTLADFITNGLTLVMELFDDADVSIFGSIAAPTDKNKVDYSFVENSSVSNIPGVIPAYSEVNDSRYDMTIKVEITGVSGTFVRGETVTFINGGTATVVYIEEDAIYVSSPIAIMTGVIQGEISGASAIATKIGTRPFKPSGEVVYQHYISPHVKMIDQNLSIKPIFRRF